MATFLTEFSTNENLENQLELETKLPIGIVRNC